MNRKVCILLCSHPQLWKVLEVGCSIVQAHDDDICVIGMDDNSVNFVILDTVNGVD